MHALKSKYIIWTRHTTLNKAIKRLYTTTSEGWAAWSSGLERQFSRSHTAKGRGFESRRRLSFEGRTYCEVEQRTPWNCGTKNVIAKWSDERNIKWSEERVKQEDQETDGVDNQIRNAYKKGLSVWISNLIKWSTPITRMTWWEKLINMLLSLHFYSIN